MMRKKLEYAVLFMAAVSIFSDAYAEDAYYSNSNLAIFITPRDAALSNADIVNSSGTSPNNNPASIASETENSLHLSYGGYFENAYNASLLSYSIPVDSVSGAGVSLCYLHIPNIEITTGLNTDADGNPIADPAMFSYASSSDIMLNIVYGRRLFAKNGVHISSGARLHALRKKLPDETGYGVGLDAGLKTEFIRYHLGMSLIVNDLLTNYIYWNSHYKDMSLPYVKFGLSWLKEIPYIYGRFGVFYTTPDVIGKERMWFKGSNETGELEIIGRGETSEQIASFLFMGRYGAEYIIRNVVALRAGFSEGDWSFGGGVSIFDSSLSIDFGYKTSELAGSYILSASYNW